MFSGLNALPVDEAPVQCAWTWLEDGVCVVAIPALGALGVPIREQGGMGLFVVPAEASERGQEVLLYGEDPVTEAVWCRLVELDSSLCGSISVWDGGDLGLAEFVPTAPSTASLVKAFIGAGGPFFRKRTRGVFKQGVI